MKVLVYQFHVEYEESNSYKFWEMSSNTCKRYADTYGFDYLFDICNIKDHVPYMFNSLNFDKFKSIEFLKDYDVVLYIDTDILITPDAENIVKIYNTGFANVVVHSSYGDKATHRDIHSLKKTKGVNSGVIIWYNNSTIIQDLYKFSLDQFMENTFSKWMIDNLDFSKKWWKDLEVFKPFLRYHLGTQTRIGYYDDDEFLDFITHLYNIPRDHLDRIYNYTFPKNKNLDLFKEDSPQFIHFDRHKKMYMKEYFDLIENMA
jgi:lipopolysaccharide biosynthesis glycosyltransferase